MALSPPHIVPADGRDLNNVTDADVREFVRQVGGGSFKIPEDAYYLIEGKPIPSKARGLIVRVDVTPKKSEGYESVAFYEPANGNHAIRWGGLAGYAHSGAVQRVAAAAVVKPEPEAPRRLEDLCEKPTYTVKPGVGCYLCHDTRSPLTQVKSTKSQICADCAVTHLTPPQSA